MVLLAYIMHRRDSNKFFTFSEKLLRNVHVYYYLFLLKCEMKAYKIRRYVHSIWCPFPQHSQKSFIFAPSKNKSTGTLVFYLSESNTALHGVLLQYTLICVRNSHICDEIGKRHKAKEVADIWTLLEVSNQIEIRRGESERDLYLFTEIKIRNRFLCVETYMHFFTFTLCKFVEGKLSMVVCLNRTWWKKYNRRFLLLSGTFFEREKGTFIKFQSVHSWFINTVTTRVYCLLFVLL